MDLTEEQRRAVERSAEPLRLQDPQTKREEILVRAEVFDRIEKPLQTEVVDPSLYEFEDPA